VTLLHDIVFDCVHPGSLARFWAAVLDGYDVAPYDDAEIERLKAAGIDDVMDDPGVLVEGPEGAPRLYFQLVPEAKVAKNRLHLDLRCDDLDGEVARLVALGATVAWETVVPPGYRNVTLRDPEGNELCLAGR